MADRGDMIPFLPLIVILAVDAPAGYDPRPILDAIRHVETGSEPDPENAVGDGGRALGPYQIHRVYWQDAVEHDPSLGGSYEDVRDAVYAERVILAYWDRYAPDWRAETLARVHNGGPKGHRKQATVEYWGKVSRRMR